MKQYALGLMVLLSAAALAQNLNANGARMHVGEQATVCGTVATALYDSKTEGQPTVLSFAPAAQDDPFSVVIPGRDRAKFTPAPESKYLSKRICVSGMIEDSKGESDGLKIVVHVPGQIQVK